MHASPRKLTLFTRSSFIVRRKSLGTGQHSHTWLLHCLVYSKLHMFPHLYGFGNLRLALCACLTYMVSSHCYAVILANIYSHSLDKCGLHSIQRTFLLYICTYSMWQMFLKYINPFHGSWDSITGDSLSFCQWRAWVSPTLAGLHCSDVCVYDLATIYCKF